LRDVMGPSLRWGDGGCSSDRNIETSKAQTNENILPHQNRSAGI
jgi:hypothetical protein